MRVFLALCVLAAGVPAWAQDASHDADVFGAPDSSRDAEVFGAPTAPAPKDAPKPKDAPVTAPLPSAGQGHTHPEDAPDASRMSHSVDDTMVGDPHIGGGRDSGPDRDAQMYGEHVSPEKSLAERIGMRQDTVAIGGQLYSRFEGYARDGARTTLSTPNLFDTYFDARPTDRIRVYLRARLEHNLNFAPAENNTDNSALDSIGLGAAGTGGGQQSTTTISNFAVGGAGARSVETRVLLDQLWVKTDIAKRVFVTAGRQQVRWGSGRFWNPTDFLNTRFRDPLTLFDERLGVGMLRLHIPVESLGWNFYAIALLDSASSFDTIGGAARAEFLVGTTEIALMGTARKGQPEQLGVDITSGIGLVDLRSEFALRHGVQTQYYGASPHAPGEQADVFGNYAFNRQNDWLFQAMVGGDMSFNYSEDDAVTVGVEAFYNQAGYNDGRFLISELAFGGYVPLYNGKFYGAAYISLPAPGQWNLSSFTLSMLGNLSDGSYQARIDFSQTVLTYITFNLYCSTFIGTPGELNLSLHRSVTVPVANADGSITPTTQRIAVGDPVAQFGMALRVYF
jgi:hypothetical protein